VTCRGLILASILLCAPLHAAEPLCVPCEVKRIAEGATDGTLSQIITSLKQRREDDPDNRAIHLLLASAYERDDNLFWARNVLYAWTAAHPADCEALSLLAWLQLRQGAPGEALSLLSENSACPDTVPMETRFSLLQDAATAAGQEDPAPPLPRAKRAFQEDRAVWLQRWNAHPGSLPPLRLRLDAATGFTSNSSAGSPTDASTDAANGFVNRLDADASFTAPLRGPVRPMVQGTARLQGFPAQALREYSYVDLAWRPGVIFGRTNRLTLAYRGNLLLSAWPGHRYFYEAHRGEAELETGAGFIAFMGAGRRIFRDGGRTRTELDGGVGGSLPMNDWLSLLAVASFRYFDAVGDPYDQAGGGPLVAALVRLPVNMRLRMALSAAVDVFPHSGGERGTLAFGTQQRRRDLTVRQSSEFWFPPLGAFHAGFAWEFNHRDSNADEAQGTLNYDYAEHRILLKLRMEWTLNPAAPRAVKDPMHVPLNWGISAGKNADMNSEIRSLLQQDEAARASSSCVE